MFAERQGVTTQTASSVVSISVTRNEYGPVFEYSSYNLTISDTTQIGSQLHILEATDQDGVSKNTIKITFIVLFWKYILCIPYE